MLNVLCGSRGRMRVPVLEALLEEWEQREAKAAYQAQLLWQVSCQIGTLLGMPCAMPDYFTLFPVRTAAVSAGQIRAQVLHDLACMDAKAPEEVSE